MRKPYDWKPWQIQFIKDNSQMTDANLSMHLGVPKTIVNRMRDTLGCKSKGTNSIMNKEMKDMAAELYEQGDVLEVIVEKILLKHGKCVQSCRLRQILQEAGVMPVKKNFKGVAVSEEDFKKLLAFNVKINSIKDIIKPGDMIKTRNIVNESKHIIHGKKYKVEQKYEDFVLTDNRECIKYDEIECILN